MPLDDDDEVEEKEGEIRGSSAHFVFRHSHHSQFMRLIGRRVGVTAGGGGAAHGCSASVLIVTHYFITTWHIFRAYGPAHNLKFEVKKE